MNNRNRVRTILALVYWVLGNICRYWVVLLLGDIFFHCDTQYDTDQTAVNTIHMITIYTSGAAVVSRRWQGEWGGSRVQAVHHHHRVLRFYVV